MWNCTLLYSCTLQPNINWKILFWRLFRYLKLGFGFNFIIFIGLKISDFRDFWQIVEVFLSNCIVGNLIPRSSNIKSFKLSFHCWWNTSLNLCFATNQNHVWFSKINFKACVKESESLRMPLYDWGVLCNIIEMSSTYWDILYSSPSMFYL